MSLDEAGQKVWDLAKIGDATAVQALLDGYSGDTAELVNWVNKDDYERTALMAASYNGHLEVVQALLSSGAMVDLQHKDGRTALM